MVTNEEIEKKKREIKNLCDDFFALSKNDVKTKEKLIVKITNLENEIQAIHRKLNQV